MKSLYMMLTEAKVDDTIAWFIDKNPKKAYLEKYPAYDEDLGDLIDDYEYNENWRDFWDLMKLFRLVKNSKESANIFILLIYYFSQFDDEIGIYHNVELYANLFKLFRDTYRHILDEHYTVKGPLVDFFTYQPSHELGDAENHPEKYTYRDVIDIFSIICADSYQDFFRDKLYKIDKESKTASNRILKRYKIS